MNITQISLALLVASSVLGGRATAQEHPHQHIEPSCDMCQAEHVSMDELAKYIEMGHQRPGSDMQVRSIDVGKANVQVALVHRGKLEERRGRVAEHDLVTEIYFVISGSGTVLTGPDLVDWVRRPADSYSVTTLNGPGKTARDVNNGVLNELKTGDVLVIPAGTGHEFVEIPDHITYMQFRVDPDKVVPLMNAEDSAEYIAERLEQ